MYSFDEVREVDNEIAEAIESEMSRQNSHIELIASENWVSKAVMAAMGSPSDQQVCRRVSGKALLRRMPVRRCSRKSGHRTCKGAVWL